jgi:hypothetical protein
VVERWLYTPDVAGSKPVPPTKTRRAATDKRRTSEIRRDEIRKAKICKRKKQPNLGLLGR